MHFVVFIFGFELILNGRRAMPDFSFCFILFYHDFFVLPFSLQLRWTRRSRKGWGKEDCISMWLVVACFSVLLFLYSFRC